VCVNLRWKLRGGSGRLVVELYGDFDETADLRELADALSGPVAIDLGGVRRINSAGVREWIEFVRNLPAVSELRLVGCSKVSVTQLNLIENFRGPARVESFWAPYSCRCGTEREILLEARDARGRTRAPAVSEVPAAPAVLCECGQVMELDELPDRYFLFLADQPVHLGPAMA
jgi:anti-anti-sigma regulatory factor